MHTREGFGITCDLAAASTLNSGLCHLHQGTTGCCCLLMHRTTFDGQMCSASMPSKSCCHTLQDALFLAWYVSTSVKSSFNIGYMKIRIFGSACGCNSTMQRGAHAFVGSFSTRAKLSAFTVSTFVVCESLHQATRLTQLLYDHSSHAVWHSKTMTRNCSQPPCSRRW